MKKFLSLVLALVMTMSLVTISAGAAEYKDLSDKSEIKYTESVAVLNKLGIITGYEDGSFKPAANLSRGAAAKIIVSLMIGAEAANGLVVNTAPYKDVAADSTFAPYISYCKTAGYISGYGDGSFRPGDPLTGYAFGKMLLGALGYDAAKEHFTGSGWTMRVASTGSKANLFRGIDGFSGLTVVTREVACAMALNTIKGTEVQYAGQNVSVSGENINVEVGNTLATAVPRLGETAGQSLDQIAGADQLMQFGEEHFPDLKLANTGATEDFLRPANQWTYKSVTIGKFAKTPLFTFTAGASGDTNLDKIRDLGLDDYNVTAASKLTVNGVTDSTPFTAGSMGLAANYNLLLDGKDTTPNYAQKGNVVEVYTSDSVADQITDIVVVQSYVMQVGSVSSTQVALKRVESTGVTVTPVTAAKNADNYKVLSGLKADDFVVVVPVRDGSEWKVAEVYAPQSVTGKLSKVSLNKSGDVNGVTVGGTDYKLSNNWTVEDADGNPKSVLQDTSVNSSNDSNVFLDKYGYMIYANKIAGSSDYIILDEVYVSNVNNRNHNIVAGWDLNGNPLTLDFGTSGNGIVSVATPGAVYAYKTSTSNNGNYQFDSAKQGTNVKPGAGNILSNAISIPSGGPSFASGVKFIFPTNNSGDVTGVTVKTGTQAVTVAYQYVLNKDGNVSAVVAINDTDVEVSQNILYVEQETNTTRDTNTNNITSIFTAYIDGVKTEGCVAKNARVVNNTFYTYAVDADGNYTLSAYNQNNSRTTSVYSGLALSRTDIVNKYVSNLAGTITGTSGAISSNLDLSSATVIDLSGDGYVIGSVSDMVDEVRVSTYDVSIIYNDGTGASKGRVSYIYIWNTSSTSYTASLCDATGTFYYDAACTRAVVAGETIYEGQTLYARVAADLSKVTGVTGGTRLTLVKAPTTTTAGALTSKAVYSFLVNGAAPSGLTGTATNWYAVTPAVVDANGLTLTATADKAVAEAGDTVVVTVNVTGTALAAGTITASVQTTNAALTLGTVANMTRTSDTAVAVTAAAVTSGSFTYSFEAAGAVTYAPTFTAA